MIFKLSALLLLFSFSEATKWPFMRCSRNDPDLDDCLLKAARDTLHKLTPETNHHLGLPILDPLHMGDFTTGVHAGPIGLDFVSNNTYMKGSTDLDIISMSYYKDEWMLEMEGLYRKLEITGDYSLVGKLLLFPINSHGTIKCSLKNVRAVHSIQFTPRDVRGVTYVNIEITTKMHSVDHMHVHVENPAIDKGSVHTVNTLLNENWLLLYKGFRPFLQKSSSEVFTNVFKSFFHKFSFDELLPENV